MKRLIWKEIHELRWWVIVSVALPCALVTLGHPLWYRGDDPEMPLAYLWPMAGFLLGAASYSKELAWDTARFLYSRPVRWGHLWLVKFGLGLLVCIATVVVPVTVYRLVCPDIYLPFADFVSLAKGTGVGLLCIGAPFICGFGCSVVASGLSWTLGVAGVSLILVAALGWIAYELLGRCEVWGLFGAPVVLCIASIALARRLTLPLISRVRLYALYFSSGVTFLLLVGLLIPDMPVHYRVTELSRNRRYVAIVEGKRTDRNWALNTLRLRSVGAQSETTVEIVNNLRPVGWSPDSRRFLYLIQPHGDTGTFLKAVEVDRLTTRSLARVPMPHWEWGSHLPDETISAWSPSGTRCAFFIVNEPEPGQVQRQTSVTGFVYGIETGALCRLPDSFVPAFLSPTWWPSDDEIATATGSTGVLTGTVIAVNVKTGKTRTLIGEKTSPTVSGKTSFPIASPEPELPPAATIPHGATPSTGR